MAVNKGDEPDIIVLNVNPRPMSYIEIKVGVDGERVALLDRLSLEVIRHIRVIDNDSKKLILPGKYGGTPSLMCILIDDQLEKMPGIKDGVIPEVIDGISFDISLK